MKLTFNYGKGVAVIPVTAIERIDKASKKDIKILLLLASERVSTIDEMVSLSSLKREEVESAIAFWRGADIIEIEEDGKIIVPPKKTAPAKGEKRTKLKSEDSLPRYTTDELNNLLEKRAEYKFLISECQQLFGKMFNPAEINIVVALSDYLGLDSEYILVLFAHLGKQEHKSVRTAEKMAHRFLDEGITDAVTLGERLRFLEGLEEVENKVRVAFGINSRALTKKEKTLIEKWLSEYHFGFDMIEKAYELTVDSTGKASLPYAGAILDRWYSEGIKNIEDAENNINEHKKKAAENAENEGGSFNTEEFFEAALRRSYGKE